MSIHPTPFPVMSTMVLRWVFVKKKKNKKWRLQAAWRSSVIFLCRTEECPMGRCLLVPGAPHPTHGARPGPSCTAVLALGPEWPAGLSRVMLSVGAGSLAHLSVRFQARSLGQIERNCHGTGLRVDMGWHGARVSHLSRGDLSVRVVWCWGAPCVLPSPEQGWFIMAPSDRGVTESTCI